MSENVRLGGEKLVPGDGAIQLYSFTCELQSVHGTAGGLLLAAEDPEAAQHLATGLLEPMANGPASPAVLSVTRQGDGSYDLRLHRSGSPAVEIDIPNCRDRLPEFLQGSLDREGFYFVIFGAWDGSSMTLLEAADYRLFMRRLTIDGQQISADPTRPTPNAVKITSDPDSVLVVGDPGVSSDIA